MHGWAGKILRVNLSKTEIKQVSTQQYAERYLGGRGIASRLYWETVAPEVKAYDPENRLIFMTGPLVATGTQAANRLSVVGKSPMTIPEKYCYGNIGGFSGAEIKKAGYDGIVIEGKASKPVYLWIQDDKAEIRDAAELWGQGIYKVGEILRQQHGKNTHFLTIGVAGENKVRTATMVGSHESASSAGFGAVMGSKNLKAVAVQGSGKPSVADPEKLAELNRYTAKISKRIRLSIPPTTEATGQGHLLEVIGQGKCYQCGLECIRGLYKYSNGSVGNRKCQAQEYYLPWLYSKKDEPVDTFFEAPTLANDYAICTFELENMVHWIHACYQAGCLTERETGLPLSQIGTREFLVKLLHSISYREGFGDVLAEGLVRAMEKVPAKARAMLSRDVAPIGSETHCSPRAFVVYSLIYGMEPRYHQPIVHDTNFLHVAWVINQFHPEVSPVTARVFHDVARVFWGSEAAGDLSSYEGKALAAVKIQNRTYIKDSLGLCDFAWPIMYSFNTPDHVGDPNLEARIFSAVTGISGEKFGQYAETNFNMQRAIMLREGHQPPQADFPVEYNFTDPLQKDHFGRPVMVPGRGDKPVDATGKTLDRDKFKAMLQEYYRLRGWDEPTGIPSARTLAALGLEDVAAVLKSR